MCASVVLAAWTVGAGAVARVGETDYETLADAAKAGGDIRLVADVEVSRFSVLASMTTRLDLAGHAITGTDPDLPAIYVVGKLVIDDTVGGGRITHKGPAQVNTAAISNSGELELAGGSICDCTGSRPAIGNANIFRMTGGMISNCVSDTTSAFENYGEFVLEGGTIIDCRGPNGAISNSGAHNNVPSKMRMTGGVIDNCGGTAEQPVIASMHELTISGGEFLNCGSNTVYNGRNGTLLVTGGRFSGGINSYRQKNMPKVEGGLFNDFARQSTPLADFMPPGYDCVANTDEATSNAYPWVVMKLYDIVLEPGQVAASVIADSEEAALASVGFYLTDQQAKMLNQARLIKKVASPNPDGTWTVSLAIDPNAEGYVPASAAVKVIADRLAEIADKGRSAGYLLTIPADCLTTSLYYWIDECAELGNPSGWTSYGRALATGRDLRFTLRRSESTSRYFTVRQSLSGK